MKRLLVGGNNRGTSAFIIYFEYVSVPLFPARNVIHNKQFTLAF